MGAIYGNEPWWQVHAFKYNGDKRLWDFHGSRAYSDASGHFERMKSIDEMCELGLARLNGGEWEYRERIQRDEYAQWVNIPYTSR